MILEGIVTTRSSSGLLNVAPMGPIVDESVQSLVLRPFQTSTTFQNLKASPFGVFHVVDDVLLLAQAAIGVLPEEPATFEALFIPGRVLCAACRWFEFRVDAIDDSDDRSRIDVTVLHAGRLRDWRGFNRAKHAVIEAAILATRLHLLPAHEVLAAFSALRSPVEKTAGPDDLAAFRLLDEFVRARIAAMPSETR